MNTIEARLARIEKRIRELEAKEEAQWNGLAHYFPIGTGYGRRPGWQKRFDRSIDRATKLTDLYRERDHLRSVIRGAERATRYAEARRSIEERLRSCKPGDKLLDAIYGVVTVVRVNRKTITIRTESGYQEARPFSMLTPLR